MGNPRKHPDQELLETTVFGAIHRLGLPRPGDVQFVDDSTPFIPVVVVKNDRYMSEYYGLWLRIGAGGACAEVAFFPNGHTVFAEAGSTISFSCSQRLFDRADRRLLFAIAGAVFQDSDVVTVRAPHVDRAGLCETEDEIPALTEALLQDALIESATAPWLRQWAFLNLDKIAARCH